MKFSMFLTILDDSWSLSGLCQILIFKVSMIAQNKAKALFSFWNKISLNLLWWTMQRSISWYFLCVYYERCSHRLKSHIKKRLRLSTSITISVDIIFSLRYYHDICESKNTMFIEKWTLCLLQITFSYILSVCYQKSWLTFPIFNRHFDKIILSLLQFDICLISQPNLN